MMIDNNVLAAMGYAPMMQLNHKLQLSHHSGGEVVLIHDAGSIGQRVDKCL